VGNRMRRTDTQIQIEILEALAFNGQLKPTHLTCKANINYRKLDNLLDNLTSYGLVNERVVEHKGVVYFITSKGLMALKGFKKNIGLESDDEWSSSIEVLQYEIEPKIKT